MAPASPVSQNKRAMKFSIFTAGLLIMVKLGAAFFSGSVAILASAADSFFDLFVSMANYFTIHQSHQPPTKNYSYGFGKLEGLAGLFQGVIIVISGGILFYLGAQKIIQKSSLDYLGISIVVMLFSMGITFWLVQYLKRVADKTKSLVIQADAAHYRSDLLANLAVILGISVIYFFDQFWLDGVISLVIALMIIWDGIKIGRKSVHNLMDREVDRAIRKKIEHTLYEYQKKQKITGYHFLRTRQSGARILVDVHLVFTEKTLLSEAHETAENIEKTIKDQIGESSVLIHLDPVDDSASQLEQKNMGLDPTP